MKARLVPPGYEYCAHCSGYGSSLKDPIDVDVCTKCGGTGLQKISKPTSPNQTQKP